MDIKDLAGLGGVFEKLIQVIANAIGIKYKPKAIRNEADAEAYRIKVIAAAVAEAQKVSGGGIEWTPEKVTIKSIEAKEIAEPVSLPDRAKARVEFQETKRQQNIETIISKTAGVLAADPDTNDEKVNDDWANRFFQYAQDVSDDEMQSIWARILAGEVKKPGSFSLRTLETIRNLSKEEAETFTRVSSLVIYNHRGPFILGNISGFTTKTSGIDFFDWQTLVENGILLPARDTKLTLDSSKAKDDYMKSFFRSGAYLLKVDYLTKSVFVQVYIIQFTKVGKEMLTLLESKMKIDYFNEFCQALGSQGDTKLQYTIFKGMDLDLYKPSDWYDDIDYVPNS